MGKPVKPAHKFRLTEVSSGRLRKLGAVEHDTALFATQEAGEMGTELHETWWVVRDFGRSGLQIRTGLVFTREWDDRRGYEYLLVEAIEVEVLGKGDDFTPVSEPIILIPLSGQD